MLKAIRAKLRPEPVREPLLPRAKHYDPPRATTAMRRRGGRREEPHFPPSPATVDGESKIGHHRAHIDHYQGRERRRNAGVTILSPRAVRTPPTEVARRQPFAVVSNSDTACRCAERRVVKSCRYQALATICRQSRDNLSARPWPPGYAGDGPAPLKPGGGAQDLSARVVAEAPGRETDRGEVRLQMARRHVDDHAAAPAGARRLELRDDDFLPARREQGARVELVETVLCDARKIGTQ